METGKKTSALNEYKKSCCKKMRNGSIPPTSAYLSEYFPVGDLQTAVFSPSKFFFPEKEKLGWLDGFTMNLINRKILNRIKI